MPYWIKVSTQQRVVRVASMLTGKSCILPALIYFIVLTSFAQDLTIKKIVAAASDHQPVKFASVAIRNTNRGTYTNLSGEFFITCRDSDSLAISAFGYKKVIYSCRSPRTIGSLGIEVSGL